MALKFPFKVTFQSYIKGISSFLYGIFPGFLQFCMAFLQGQAIINDFLYGILNGGLNRRFKHMPYKNSTTILV